MSSDGKESAMVNCRDVEWGGFDSISGCTVGHLPINLAERISR